MAQERERQHRIKEQEIKNLDGVRHIETEKLKSILKKLGLTFHQVRTKMFHCSCWAFKKKLH